MRYFNPGDPVYIVLRDDSDEPVEVAGYIFLACVNDVVIAAPGINGHRDLDYVLAYLMALTRDDDELLAVAAPVDDCYLTLGAAKEAMRNELDN